MPFLLVSDLHFHSWSAFSTVDPTTGVNSRLESILQGLREGVASLDAAGGSTIVIAGDIFHKRGSIEPSVLNPVMDEFRGLTRRGYRVYAIPGNHDLASNESERVNNAVTALESVGVIVAHEPYTFEPDPGELWVVTLFPWRAKVADLICDMETSRNYAIDGYEESGYEEPFQDAIIHAPIDGVLPHLEGHGASASALSDTGFTRVFAGHYHHHRDMGDEVYSIGALTHQTWGDIGSRAGYMLVYSDHVEQFETSQPKFVEITGDESDSEAIEKAEGNYVRVQIEVSGDGDLADIRKGVLDLGAKGVVVIPIKRAVVARAISGSSTSVSIESSIKAYLDKRSASANAHALALDILSVARGV